ncbi:MAG: single-stranded DNA-binding protein [Chloroflexi bacterium]|nr:single-stranded DNA-binding protein [Chloroflexota bacterium]
MSFHTLIIVGRLGQDPEMRYMPNGQAVTNFSVASDRSYRNAGGELVKVTTWFRVSVWGKQAESCNQYLNKGSMVLIEGTLNPDKDTGRPRLWTSADGRSGSSYDVNAQTVRFLSTRGSGQDSSNESDSGAPEVDEDNIPF